jgi:hypothetical protein
LNISLFGYLPVVTAAIFLLQSPAGQCHLPELFGREYIRLVDEPEEPLAPGNSAAGGDSAANGEDPSQYREQLEQIEISQGPYASGLTDPLIGLAEYQKSAGRLDESLQSYRRALHLIRVNDGLASERQLPILRAILGIYKSAADHPALGDLYKYYHRVMSLDDPPYTDERLKASLEYYAWERELYIARSDGLQRAHLMRAYQANERLLEDFIPADQREVEWYLRLCMSQLRTLYLILGDDYPQLDTGLSGEDLGTESVDRKMSFLQKVAYSRGQDILTRGLQYAQSSAPVNRATMHLELGDWLQWNGGLARANEQYALVEKILLAAGEQKLLALWLDEPVELPDERDLWPLIDSDNKPDAVVVEAHYSVNSRGDVKSLKASVLDEEQRWQASRIKRMLRDTHFRPRFNDGEPRSMDDVTRHYRLIDMH